MKPLYPLTSTARLDVSPADFIFGQSRGRPLSSRRWRIRTISKTTNRFRETKSSQALQSCSSARAAFKQPAGVEKSLPPVRQPAACAHLSPPIPPGIAREPRPPPGLAPLAARAPEARPCCLRPPSVRSSLTDRPLSACSRFRCALVHSLRWHGNLWLSLWLGLLLPGP